MHYQVISAYNINELEAAVNNLSHKGYYPCGTLVAIPGPKNIAVEFLQPMLHRDKSNELEVTDAV